MRVAVVDLGTNSTRLLVADVGEDGSVEEIARRSTVTRLGQDLERSGVLAREAIRRVAVALEEYRAVIDDLDVDIATGVLTSAARDAANGGELTALVCGRYAIDARTITGDEEAQLTYLGATSERRDDGTTLVVDIGGGSTEFVVGSGEELLFHVSTQVGVVRHSERHLHDDPPTTEQLQALRDDVAAEFAEHRQVGIETGIAVAGTATSCAAMLLELEPYDPDRVEGYVLRRDAVDALLERTAALTLPQRRELPGLHPDRAPTIIAGIAILLETMTAFELGEVTVSEHDILRGVALSRAREG
ncbi:MAG TPA: Ppx/GppA phosphatase family protein [Solirubrobacteraceae bacterium]|nr:Ppx/GppA phosphatase family protein [Solirubrobacteraceae bacterium]